MTERTEHSGIPLEEGETIIRIVRRDLFIFIVRLSFIALGLLIPLLLSPFLARLLDTVRSERGATVFMILYLFWVLILFMRFFYKWTDYFLDVWIVTNRRVFDIEQQRLFSRIISVFPLENIQDITIEMRGIIPTMFKFGNVHIHTAGEKQDLIIRHARHPMEVKQILSRVQHEALDKSGQYFHEGL